jgi:hypothetical protein
MKYNEPESQVSRQGAEYHHGVERHTHEAVPLDAVFNKKSYPEKPDERISREPEIPEPAAPEISID